MLIVVYVITGVYGLEVSTPRRPDGGVGLSVCRRRRVDERAVGDMAELWLLAGMTVMGRSQRCS